MPTNTPNSISFYDFQMTTLDGKIFDFCQLKGKKVMIVNVASKCGFTPQYQQLEELYQKNKDKNFEILGFPSSDFANQEFNESQEIANFCQKNYGVTFPIFEKITVKGQDKHLLYQWLTEKSKNGVQNMPVLWNFQKFIIDQKGNWTDYFLPTTNPSSNKIIKWINS
jgi:glutathione peroxidase